LIRAPAAMLCHASLFAANLTWCVVVFLLMFWSGSHLAQDTPQPLPR